MENQMKGILSKVETNHNRVRTDEVEGEFVQTPEVGKSFLIFGEALCPVVKAAGGFRKVNTSIVQKVDWDPHQKEFTFKTLNSVYKLRVLS